MFLQCLSSFETLSIPFPSDISKSVLKLAESSFFAISISSVSKAKPKTLSPFFSKCSLTVSARGPLSFTAINSKYRLSGEIGRFSFPEMDDFLAK